MKKTLENELTVTFDEAFHEMSDEEMRGMNMMGGAPSLAISDPQRHMIITFGNQKLNGFAAMVLSVKDIAKKAEEAVCKAMKPYDYHMEEFVKMNAGGKEADGFRFTYTAQNTAMTGETLVVKHGKSVWYYNGYFRTESAEESEKVFQEIVSSSQWNS